MLSDAQVSQIKRLLKYSALSQRDIAREVGVSRGTVLAIAHGRYRRANEQPPLAAEQSTPPENVPAVRCGDCGALVYPPCRACRLRARIVSSGGKLRV